MSWQPSTESGLLGWWAARAISGASNGDAVDGWVDLSGQGRNLSQDSGVASRRPTYRTNALNGFPAVRFNASNSSTLAAALTMSQPAVSIFGVYNLWAAQPDTQSSIIDGYSGLNTLRLFASDAANHLFMYAGGYGPDVQMPAGFHVLAAIFNGSSSKLGYSAASIVNGTTATTSPGGIRVGANTSSGSGSANVEVVELFAYDHALTTTVQANAFAYLNSLYFSVGLPVNARRGLQ